MNVADSFRQEGRQEIIVEIVRNMLDMGADPEFIRKATGLSITELENLMQ